MQQFDPSLGRRFRQVRIARGLSLNDVAEATQISSSFLSLFENGKNDITFGRLARLSSFFGLAIDELIPDPEPAETVVVHRNARRRIASSEERAVSELLTHDTKHKLGAMLFTLERGGVILEGIKIPEGELFVLILRGKFEALPHGQAPITLDKDDAALFRIGHMPCPLFRNIGRGSAELLMVGVTTDR
jgi:transcriptional regulator with XRE-family HTH domain